MLHAGFDRCLCRAGRLFFSILWCGALISCAAPDKPEPNFEPVPAGVASAAGQQDASAELPEPKKRNTGPLPDAEKWVLLPLINETRSFNASANATAITQKYLLERGVTSDVLVPTQFDARGFQYIVTGRVIAWRNAGKDNQRAQVSIALQAFDLHKRRLLWRDELSKTGRPGDSLLMVGNDVLKRLVARISVAE